MENSCTSSQEDTRKVWIEPAIRSLDVGETSATPNLGADLRGNPFPDCQDS